MPDAITLSELERRNRAAARAREVWAGALTASQARPDFSLRECIDLAGREYDALMQRCVDAEPPTDPKEFGFGGMPGDG